MKTALLNSFSLAESAEMQPDDKGRLADIAIARSEGWAEYFANEVKHGRARLSHVLHDGRAIGTVLWRIETDVERELVIMSVASSDPRLSISADFVLENPSGLHVLPAARLVKLASEYRAKIEISHGDRTADAKDLMEVLALGAECGSRVAVTATGADAAQGLAAIRSLVAKKFHDDSAPVRRIRPGKCANP